MRSNFITSTISSHIKFPPPYILKNKNLIKIIVALFFLSTNIAFAENSGVFFGFGMGGGGIKADTAINDEDGKSKISVMLNTLDWGVMGGYKHFFTQNFGARFYANFIVAHASMIKTQFDDASYTQSEFLINYTANVDLLYNFYQNANIELGGFVGLGLGGSSHYLVNSEGYNLTQHAFDIGINFGLRTQFSHNHDIELVARVPFLPFMKGNNASILPRINQRIGDGDTSVRQAFSLMMRYAYTFGNTPKKTQANTQNRAKTIKKIRRKTMD